MGRNLFRPFEVKLFVTMMVLYHILKDIKYLMYNTTFKYLEVLLASLAVRFVCRNLI